MSYNGGNAKFPGAIGSLKAVRDKIGTTAFEAAAWQINAGDEVKTVPAAAPYVIRLDFVPQEIRDSSGNPIGVTFAGLTEVPYDKDTAPASGKFMVNYINGEVKFNPDKANQNVQPAYKGTMSWVWAEIINELLRELKAVQTVLGINVQGAYTDVKARIKATEDEVVAARGGYASIDARMDNVDANLAPLAGASLVSKEPSAQTGVLGTASVVFTANLDIKEATVVDGCVEVRDSANALKTLNAPTLGADGKTVTVTHAGTWADDVYTVTVKDLQDTLGRAIPTTTWKFAVGAAVANDKPNVTSYQALSPSGAGFTAKGGTSDTENDTITRIDIGYSQTNDPATATIQQLVGADITAFKGAGKALAVSLAAGTWYTWARALEQWPDTTTQLGEWCAAQTFNVAAVPVPAAPTGLTATPGNNQVVLDWANNAGGDNVTLYNVYRSTTSGSGFVKIGENANSAYTDSTATNGVHYYYRVTAVNAGGESTASAEANATPANLVAPVISINDSLGVPQIGKDWARLRVTTAAIGATKYDVYEVINASPVLKLSDVTSLANCVITGLDTAVKNHSFYIMAKDDIGNTAMSNTVNGDILVATWAEEFTAVGTWQALGGTVAVESGKVTLTKNVAAGNSAYIQITGLNITPTTTDLYMEVLYKHDTAPGTGNGETYFATDTEGTFAADKMRSWAGDQLSGQNLYKVLKMDIIAKWPHNGAAKVVGFMHVVPGQNTLPSGAKITFNALRICHVKP